MIKSKKMIMALALASAISIGTTKAEPFAAPMNFGLYGGVDFNMHSPSMSPLFTVKGPTANTTFTTKFNENATGTFMYIGAIGNFPINEMFTVSGRIGYNGMRGTLEQDSIDANGRPAFVNSMETSLNYLEIQPEVHVHNLFGENPLFVSAGLNIGVPLSVTYDMKVGESTLVADENVPDKNFRMALALGVGYMYEISDNIYLTPEASFHIPLTKVSAANSWDSWSVSQLRIGVALTFGFGDKKQTQVNQKGSHSIKVGMGEVRYYDKRKAPHRLDKITVEETQYSELFPLIPYVFYSENTANPLETTNLSGKREAGEFTIKELAPDAMLINNQTLDIVGLRMKENKNSKITLTGTIDAKGETNEALAIERANNAKNYLVENYGLSTDRIEVKGTKLPAKPSATKDPDGIAENRRVEIFASTSDITAPIVIEKDKQRIAAPDLIGFLPKIVATDSITRWSMEISQSGRLVRRIDGTKNQKEIQWVIIPNELAPSQIPLDYTLKVEMEGGLSDSYSGSIPVDYFSFTRKKTDEQADKTVSKFSLVVFDFDSPNVSEADKNILNEYVIPAINPKSTVQIYGYTDRIGDDSYNAKLANQRAENVKAYLESKSKASKYEIFGVGENETIFDNNAPVGRQLSRTVQIYVSTPKQK